MSLLLLGGAQLPFNAATGGTVTDYSNYLGSGQKWRVHEFTSNSTFTVTINTRPFRLLIVGGGGGGGGGDNAHHGQGGNGGYGTDQLRTFTCAAHTVTIGGSGAAVSWGYAGSYGGTGGQSVCGPYTANGGGGGADLSDQWGATNGPSSSARANSGPVQYGAGNAPNTGCPCGACCSGTAGAANTGQGGGGATQYSGGSGPGGTGLVVVAYQIG